MHQVKWLELKIDGMTCSACVAHVEKAISSLDGVETVSVNLVTEKAEVRGEVTADEVVNAVKKAGYSAELLSVEDAASGGDDGSAAELISSDSDEGSPTAWQTPEGADARKSEPEQNRRSKSPWQDFILAASFSVPLMIVAMWNMALPHPNFYLQILQPLLVIPVVGVGRGFFIRGFRNIVKLAPNMDSLIALGSIAALVYSVWEMLAGKHHLYFESAAMIITLVLLGKTLEKLAKAKSGDALKQLAKLVPETVTLTNGAAEREVIPLEMVKIGDELLIKGGEKIPVDGVIIAGDAEVDESMLTGESVSVRKTAGDKVFAATINRYGEWTMRAERVGKDTALANIIKMVETAQMNKLPIARLADKVSGYFVPVVVAIAVLAGCFWLFYRGDTEIALQVFISVLVIACPCALGLATPVAIMAGTGAAAKQGILFKGGEALELLHRVQTVALDKTGTLTEGNVRLLNSPRPEERAQIDARMDRIRPTSAPAIRSLSEMRVKTVMITGDKLEVAEKVAAEVGVDKFEAEVFPGDKARIVSELEGVTAFVGDGINDAPALAAASVGVAIGSGADIAIEAADVVLMHSDLQDLPKAIDISRRTMRNIRQNLFWAFAYNLAGIPIAAGALYLFGGPLLSPMFASLAMSLSSVTVVLNALRLSRQ